MKTGITAISLHLSSSLLKSSEKLAKHLHMSRAEFMRMAIEHEVKRWRIKQEQMAMAKSFEAMNRDERYLQESEEIMDGLDMPIDDGEAWWKQS